MVLDTRVAGVVISGNFPLGSQITSVAQRRGSVELDMTDRINKLEVNPSNLRIRFESLPGALIGSLPVTVVIRVTGAGG